MNTSQTQSNATSSVAKQCFSTQSDLISQSAPTATLASLILENREFHPIYSGYLSNHLPMALIALHKMGASDNRLKEYFASYKKKLNYAGQISSDVRITQDNWKIFLGHLIFFMNYMAFFDAELSRLGRKATLELYFPQMMEGIIAEAFHAVLFIGYGIEADSDDLISQGLAFLAFHYESLGPLRESVTHLRSVTSVSDLVATLARIRSEKLFCAILSVTRPLEFPRKQVVVSQFTDLLSNYDLNFGTDFDTAVDIIAEAMLKCYADTLDFFILHGVTGFRALTQICRVLSDSTVRTQILRCFWRAITALYVIQGLPEIRGDYERFIADEALPTWDTIYQTAVRDNDEHVIKFIYACWAESTDHPRLAQLYHRMAAEKARLIGHSNVPPS